jgi:biopolymer transport protein ExbD
MGSAAGKSGRGRGAAITGINVTPLVDITLVLLIIFMVTAKLIVNRSALSVDLPKAATGGEVQEILSVVIGKTGRAELNGKPLTTDEELLAPARNAVKKDREVRAVIKADGSIAHERVMHVLDLLRNAGVAKVAFGVAPIASPQPTTGGGKP